MTEDESRFWAILSHPFGFLEPSPACRIRRERAKNSHEDSNCSATADHATGWNCSAASRKSPLVPDAKPTPAAAATTAPAKVTKDCTFSRKSCWRKMFKPGASNDKAKAKKKRA